MKSIIISTLCLASLFACNTPKATEPTQEPGAASNPVIETIMARRSIRAYKPQAVEAEKMDQIALCGINAPNGMNAQNWEVRLTSDPSFIADATAAYKEVMKDDARAAKMFEEPGFKNMFRNAPTLAFIATKDGRSQLDAGLLSENMILAAHSMGIGSVCLGGPARFFTSEEGKPFLDRLAFSEGYQLVLIIGFGYPDESPDAKPRDLNKVQWMK